MIRAVPGFEGSIPFGFNPAALANQPNSSAIYSFPPYNGAFGAVPYRTGVGFQSGVAGTYVYGPNFNAGFNPYLNGAYSSALTTGFVDTRRFGCETRFARPTGFVGNAGFAGTAGYAGYYGATPFSYSGYGGYGYGQGYNYGYRNAGYGRWYGMPCY